MVVLEGKWRQLQESELRSVFSTPFYSCQLYQTPPFPPYFGLCMWVCLKMVYTPNYSHLVGIMISKTIGFRGTRHFQTHPCTIMYSFFAKHSAAMLGSRVFGDQLGPQSLEHHRAQGVPSPWKTTYFSFHISYSTTLTSVDISTDIWHRKQSGNI